VTCGSSRQLLSSHKSGFNRMTRRIWHVPHATSICPIRLIWTQWLLFVSYRESKARKHLAGWRGPIFESLQEIVGDIDQEKLNSIFQAWMPRVQKVSSGNRDDVR
jgi:hypothetical protein